MNRVVITGLGCLSPIGDSPGALWNSLLAGQSGIRPYLPEDGVADPTLRFTNIAQVQEFDPSSLSSAQLTLTERCARFALLASRQAMAESGLLDHHASGRIALILGCSTNGRHAEEPEIGRVYTDNARVHPLTIPRSMASTGLAQVAMDHHITGPAFTVSTACASGAHAIGLAFQMVRSGLVSAALAGAHEAPLTRSFLRAWDSMRVVSPTVCRPFSADRDGMTLAEGAALLTLETLASARARNATIYAEVLGFGMSTDAYHITQPRPEGAAQAIVAALDDGAQTLAGTSPEPGEPAQPGDAQSLREQVACISAHGTATRANDSSEAAALELVFGPRLARIPLFATKGFHGHSLGASSALETLITALALHHRTLPFTAGTTTRDPDLPVDLVLNTPRALLSDQPTLALANSLAFGGLNAMLLLRTAP